MFGGLDLISWLAIWILLFVTFNKLFVGWVIGIFIKGWGAIIYGLGVIIVALFIYKVGFGGWFVALLIYKVVLEVSWVNSEGWLFPKKPNELLIFVVWSILD